MATVSGGLVSGVSPGRVTITATISGEAGGVCRSLSQQCPVFLFGGSSGGTVQVLGSFAISVTSTPVQGETNSVVSGESAQVQVVAKDQNGSTFTGYRGTVHFSSTDTLATLPGSYTYTGSDSGVHSFSVTLKTVAGTSATRDLTVSGQGAGVSSEQNIDVWFQVIATREGLVGQLTACGHTITTNDHFVALPSTGLCNMGVRLRNGSNVATTAVFDVGPWCPHPQAATSNPCVCPNDPYWQTSGVPFAARNSCSSNGAGIDLADGTFSDLGLASNGVIVWRFQ